MYYSFKKQILIYKHEAYWIGWFCVDENYRGNGFGTRLLDFAEGKATEEKKFLRLYTTNHERLKLANEIYAKRGYRIISKKKIRNKNYYYIYRELKFG